MQLAQTNASDDNQVTAMKSNYLFNGTWSYKPGSLTLQKQNTLLFCMSQGEMCSNLGSELGSVSYGVAPYDTNDGGIGCLYNFLRLEDMTLV